ncbi:helix-turn-helix transcriptional regulator [Paeniglutamicibacter psychrophenolicus]|uniref:DNA-binding XRE family transcriptional regulator n=2 Tax=Paeniglutamicibacter psychrophenolicus TaxID=257454 RepID=A0ABS4WI00_9MICC|nr:helix-turn-helix transcriptional regulator [Paeniglutamicibacter psychrophenolicus]MBP2375563.1 DNA-binding XRE family transcriptional regulator [Paeniglutamicibacter psychrophenolicus]
MENFRDLARRAQESWSEVDHKVYESASTDFKEDVDAQIAFGRQLATLRSERHWSQAHVAELTGLQQSEISRIERGAANPTIATATKMAKAFGKELKLA